MENKLVIVAQMNYFVTNTKWVQVEAGFKRVIFFAFFLNEELLGSNINKLH